MTQSPPRPRVLAAPGGPVSYLIVPQPPTAAMVEAGQRGQRFLNERLEAANAAGACALADVPGLREVIKDELSKMLQAHDHGLLVRRDWAAEEVAKRIAVLLAGAAPAQETP